MALFGSSDLGLDLGTSVLHIVTGNKGIVLSDPSYVAFERESRNVIAVGEDAMRMYGRTPAGIMVERPFREAHIRSFDLVSKMMRFYIHSVAKSRVGFRPRLLMALPSGMAPTERQTLIDVAVDAGVRNVIAVDESVASAVGGNVRIDQPYGRMNIDIGGARTNLSVFSMGHQIVWYVSELAGDRFDEAIIDFMRRKHNLLIGDRTAENLKINLGAARVQDPSLQEETYGHSLISGLPRAVTVTAGEIGEAMEQPLHDLISIIQRFIERTPPELASDIFDEGITLSGGSARIYGLDDMLSDQLKIPVRMVDEPDLCVAHGLQVLMTNEDLADHVDLSTAYIYDRAE